MLFIIEISTKDNTNLIFANFFFVNGNKSYQKSELHQRLIHFILGIHPLQSRDPQRGILDRYLYRGIPTHPQGIVPCSCTDRWRSYHWVGNILLVHIRFRPSMFLDTPNHLRYRPKDILLGRVLFHQQECMYQACGIRSNRFHRRTACVLLDNELDTLNRIWGPLACMYQALGIHWNQLVRGTDLHHLCNVLGNVLGSLGSLRYRYQPFCSQCDDPCDLGTSFRSHYNKLDKLLGT